LLQTNIKPQFDQAVTARSKLFFHFFSPSNRIASVASGQLLAIRWFLDPNPMFSKTFHRLHPEALLDYSAVRRANQVRKVTVKSYPVGSIRLLPQTATFGFVRLPLRSVCTRAFSGFQLDMPDGRMKDRVAMP
jgi:hypothetical protein